MTHLERRQRQQLISSLLGTIDQRRGDLERLKGRGVRGPALAPVKAEIDDARSRLAAVLGS